jgi:hypothetical protein
VESYRAYRFAWSASPGLPPLLVASRAAGATTTTLTASWNGATSVASWQVLAGASATSLAPVGTPTPNAGFETSITAATTAPYVAVEPLSSSGQALSESAAVAVSS